EAITPGQARLLGALAQETHRDAVRSVALDASSAGARRAAALALAASEEEFEFILEGTATRPSWFDAAARAVSLHRPTASGFLELLRVAPEEGAWTETAARTLVAMPPDQRLVALRAVRDLARRDELLTGVLRLLQGEQPAAARELLLLQAETRLERGDPDGALSAANAALRDAPTGATRAERVRFLALVAL